EHDGRRDDPAEAGPDQGTAVSADAAADTATSDEAAEADLAAAVGPGDLSPPRARRGGTGIGTRSTRARPPRASVTTRGCPTIRARRRRGARPRARRPRGRR